MPGACLVNIANICCDWFSKPDDITKDAGIIRFIEDFKSWVRHWLEAGDEGSMSVRKRTPKIVSDYLRKRTLLWFVPDIRLSSFQIEHTRSRIPFCLS